MFHQFDVARREYPGQYWLMFWGMLISTIGASMIWPFLMIYVSERLQLPLATVASLMTLSSALGLISSMVAGPIVDRVGRKWVMALSLFMNALGYLFMSQANTLAVFALLMGINGTFNPLYRVGADAMMADLIPPERRVDAYSLTRMSNNLGVALGPAIGGLIAATSYHLAFYFAAAGLGIYSLLVTFFAHETLPTRLEAASHPGAPAGRPATLPSGNRSERFGGYAEIFRDRPFMGLIAYFTFGQISVALIWVLMAVYAKRNFGIPESQYGFIPTTNALMVVTLQLLVTRFTKRYAPLSVLAAGSFIYALSVGGVALARGFWGFWAMMVIMTIGELMLAPTSSTYAANLAPSDKRGRYMSLYGLTWGVASGIGPVLGGALNDNLGPQWIWIGGGLVGMVAAIGFLGLSRRVRVGAPEPLPADGQAGG